jgi:GR25 family glycosyltransferase involved in LPS biosynthesis
MKKPKRKLRVGVTIGIRQGQQSLWENGIGQNCIFMAMLFGNCPEVETVVLINASGLAEVSPAMMLGTSGVTVIPLSESAGLDVIIEMGAQLPDQWVADYRKGGGKYAAMRVGNDYAIDIERAIFDMSPGSLCTAKTFDAVWTIPGHAKSCTDYFSVTTRSPVTIVPHIWSPFFFQKGIDAMPEGQVFGYRPGRERWRVCTFEPNINMVKTSFLPMFVCEEAYRLEPRFLEFYRICNTFHLKERPLLIKTATSLDIVNHGLTTFEGRFQIYDFLSRQGDCVLSHQWECPQNYVYYEALYGRYPLIHNSPLMKDYGYYYPEFDSQEGGRVLVEAFRTHDENIEAYERKCSSLMRQIDVDYPGNIEAYTRELLALYGVRSGEMIDLPDTPDPVPRPGWKAPSGAIAAGISEARVINLDRRPDRMASFLEANPSLASSVTRSPAVDGKMLTLSPSLARLFAPNSFQWKKPVIGCALSHLRLWKELSTRPDSEGSWLILEDDARLLPDWKGKWEDIALSGSAPRDWDVLFLGGILPPNREAFKAATEHFSKGIGRIAPNGVFGQKPPTRYFHFCAYAYLMTPAGARKALSRIRRHQGVWTPADHILCNQAGDDMGIFFTDPMLAGCFQDEDPGYVGANFNDPAVQTTFDSDLRNSTDGFGDKELGPALDAGASLDIDEAIQQVISEIP